MLRNEIVVRVAHAGDRRFIPYIINEIEEASKIPGTGICKRPVETLSKKMIDGEAIIALTIKGEWVGFCYIQAWSNFGFVSSCALVVAKGYRNYGVASKIKKHIFSLAKDLYPNAKLFGLTTNFSVMKINLKLGYKPVTYSEVTQDPIYWQACLSCQHYNILIQQNKKKCLCTAMIYEK